MCSPTALLGAQAAGGAASTVGAYYAAQSQRNQLGLQADLADVQARQALLAGEREQQRSRLATANLKSRQVVSMAANGVALDEGSPVRVLTSTDALGEIDANTIEHNAVAQAWGYRTQATLARGQASGISPGLSAFTTFLGSATQVASSWYGMRKAGLFDAQTAGGSATTGSGIKPPAASTGWWSA